MAEKRLTRAKLIRWAKAHHACADGLAAFVRTTSKPIDVLKRWSGRAFARGPCVRDFFLWVRTHGEQSAFVRRADNFDDWRDLNAWAYYDGPPAWDVLERVIIADLARIEERRRG